MAPSSRPGAAPLAPNDAQPKPQPSNGVLTTANTPAGTINRKKAKRRQKQAAKQHANIDSHNTDYADDDDDYANGDLSTMHNPPPADLRYDGPYPPGSLPQEGQFGYENDGDLVYSDEEADYAAYANLRNGPNSGTAKKSRKKKKAKAPQQEPPPLSAGMPGHYPSPLPPPPPTQTARPSISEEALRTVQRRATKDAIWDTSSSEERLRIKEFWLNLEEDTRKSLVKIEKEAVLRKMKEQQKHSCSCTVCGRKRTAIEEELEVLYDAYYEELEQFAEHGKQSLDNSIAPARPSANNFRHPLSRGPPDRGLPSNRKGTRGRIEELVDDEEEDDEEDLDDNDDELSDDVSYDDDYTSTNTDEVPPDNTPASDFFSFGKSLTVKGGILTVADDLLKNDGQKFIDMMEQLAERRMQREEDAAMGPYRVPQHQQQLPPVHGQHPHVPLPPEDDEYSDEEDDEEYDSQGDELDEDEDEMDTMTEEQRMEEGRRMFQIFAARMFEQRVLTAYREKVAVDRQNQLIAELGNDEERERERQAKKERDALKKKQKKAQAKAAKDQKAQQKAEAEAKAKADEEARLAEQKRKREEQREEQRKKKEEDRKKVEEEKARKEAEKQRRQMLEREKQQEAERKSREAKAEEKRRREEAKHKDREARESKEREARERREQAEHDKRMKDEQIRRSTTQQDPLLSGTADPSKRVLPPAKVALPPGLVSNSGIPSPQPKVATPVLPKAPTPVKPRDISQSAAQRHGAESSDASSKQSTPQKVPSFPQNGPPQANMPRAPSHSGLPPFAQHAPGHPIAPPPGMQHPPNSSLPGFSAGPMSPFGAQGPMMGASQRTFSGQQLGMYPPNSQQMGHRPGFAMPTPPGPPPGMNHPGMGRGYPESGPASYLPHGASAAPGYGPSQQGSSIPSHSRQPSGSSPIGPPGAGQPIGRPGAIRRPASVKPQDGDVDDLSTHLGSSALLADDDEPLETPRENSRPGAGLGMPLGRQGFAEGPLQPAFGSPFNPGPASFAGLGGRVPGADASWVARGPAAGQFGGPPGMAGPGGWGSAATPGGGWGSAGSFAAPMHRGSTSRPMATRKLACAACHQLAAAMSGGYSDLLEVLQQMQQARGDLAIQRRELEDILDTEDMEGHNGGGHFVRRGNMVMHVQPANARAGTGLGLGEIGSPVQGISIPNLPNLGRF